MDDGAGVREDTGHPAGPARRNVIAGAGAAGVGALGVIALAGCGAGGGTKPEPSVPARLKGKVIAKTSDVPVGGGTILTDDKIVVTQPAKGDFKAFTAVCTHQGCTVGDVQKGVIQCPCHGSEFSAKDGSVKQGPASRPLAEFTVKVVGDGITVS
ncbi:MAG TPA: Rieske (2Fe-2S) protein [Streptosporangiaceae bacterium]|jgi:Rieske Fe-S protein